MNRQNRTERAKDGNLKMKVMAALFTSLMVISGLFIALDSLPEASAPEIGMTLLSDPMKEVGYGGSAIFEIDVGNGGDEDIKVLELDTENIPATWSATLTDIQGREVKFISLDVHQNHQVFLTVSAPTMEAAAEAEKNGILSMVAHVGVRGGNVTVGTVTVLTRTLDLKREGNTTTLERGDNYTVLSGDMLTANGFAVVEVDLSILFSNKGIGLGTIYVGMHKAKVGFWRFGDLAFMWVYSGKVIIISINGGGGGVRADGSEWDLNIGDAGLPGGGIPGLDYNAVLSFGPDAPDGMFTLDVGEDGNTSAAVYSGNLGVTNQGGGNTTLGEMEALSGTPGGQFPPPGPARATLIEVETGGDSQEEVTVNGQSIFDVNNSFVVQGAGGRNIYLLPFGSGQDPGEISVTLRGTAEGSYTTRFTRIDDYSVRSFDIFTSSTVNTLDVITMSRDIITMDSNEVDKKYDLTIAYRGRGQEEVSFSLTGIKTSDRSQKIEVTNWGELGGAVSPVEFTDGDTTVTVNDGDNGEDIKNRVNDKRDTGEDPVASFMVIMMVVGIALTIVGLMMFVFRKGGGGEMMPPLIEEKERVTKPEEEMWAPKMADTYPPKQEETWPQETDEKDLEQEMAEVSKLIATPMSVVSDDLGASMPEKIFPMSVECHNCGRVHVVEKADEFTCAGCATRFGIGEDGSYNKLVAPVEEEEKEEELPEPFVPPELPVDEPEEPVDPFVPPELSVEEPDEPVKPFVPPDLPAGEAGESGEPFTPLEPPELLVEEPSEPVSPFVPPELPADEPVEPAEPFMPPEPPREPGKPFVSLEEPREEPAKPSVPMEPAGAPEKPVAPPEPTLPLHETPSMPETPGVPLIPVIEEPSLPKTPEAPAEPVMEEPEIRTAPVEPLREGELFTFERMNFEEALSRWKGPHRSQIEKRLNELKKWEEDWLREFDEIMHEVDDIKDNT